MGSRIAASHAKVIAENFVKQYHSISNVQEPELKGDSWIVEIDVSLPSFKKFHIKVNARTGLIAGF